MVRCMDLTAVAGLLDEQDGVLARRQALAAGLTDEDLRRLRRRREIATVHTGVYVDHTGPLSWTQRAWAAVLFAWPAAICPESALVAHGVRWAVRRLDQQVRRLGFAAPVIHVAVDERRRVSEPDGVPVHRVTRLADQVQGIARPPRLRLEPSLVQVAAAAGDDATAIAVLADACQERRTTPARLVEVVRGHPNLPGRKLLLGVLEDVATGAYSLLEHRYLTRVERPHGLPTGGRQRAVRAGRAAAYRDVEYLGLGAVVELDGRLGHELATDRWDDLDRDITSLLVGDTTMRLGWRHVLQPCRTAAVVDRFLVALGWDAGATPCGPGCAVAQRGLWSPSTGGSSAPGARNPPEPPRGAAPCATGQAQSWPSRASSASSMVPS